MYMLHLCFYEVTDYLFYYFGFGLLFPRNAFASSALVILFGQELIALGGRPFFIYI